MRFTVVTIFPELFESVLAASVVGRAIEAGLVTVDFIDPRDFTRDRHRTVDDEPYGGGPGMVMKVEPVVEAIESADGKPHRILLTPQGAPLAQERVCELAEKPHLLLVCGRYEGMDERVTTLAIDEMISLGDFVMTGGEIGAAALIDAVSRYVPGVLGEATSTDDESFSAGLLEYPQYTRPREFRGEVVPEVLTSGHHARITEWRTEQSLGRTARSRPELLAREAREHGPIARLAARTFIVLAHHPVYDRTGAVVTTAVTNLDLHDIARTAATYGLGGYFVTTPVEAQREKVVRIVTAWTKEHLDVDNRRDALSRVCVVPTVQDALDAIAEQTGAAPHVVATSAQAEDGARIGYQRFLRTYLAESMRPIALVFGTGWGLSSELIAKSEQVLEPIAGHSPFNHLSVRSAVAVICDRLFGLRG